MIKYIKVSDKDNTEFIIIDIEKARNILVTDCIEINFNDRLERIGFPKEQKKDVPRMIQEWLIDDEITLLDLCLTETT